MFSRIQKRFHLNLPLATLFLAPTIKEIALLLQDHFNVDGRPSQKKTSSGPQSAWTFAAPIKSSGNLHPFFCVHGVGGNVLNYYPLVSFLDKEQPLYGLQCRGVDGVSPLFGSVAVMAREYIKEIRQIQPHGPYFLGGGSMGGLVAFEMAQQLSSMNEPIGLLAMFDSVCPRLLKSGAADPAQKSEGAKPVKSLLARVRHSIWCRIRDALKTANCLKYRLAGRPIPHELRYWRIEQHNLAIARAYKPPPYKGLITMFFATLDKNCLDRYRGWKSVALGGMEFIDITCIHENMVEQHEFAPKLNEVLQSKMVGKK
jgi:thioesterase domain-containing protein